MSGFFVSNSFGRFNSEAATKKFNATITYPGGPAEATLEELWDWPHQTGKRTNFGGKWPSDEAGNGGWAYKKFHYYYKGNFADAGTGSNSTDMARIFPWDSKDSTSVKDKYYRGGSGDAVHYAPMPNTITKFKMTVYTNGPEMLENVTYGGTSYGKTLIEACNDSSIVCLQNYKDKGDGKAEYDVYLYGDDGDYFSIDMDGNVSGVASYKMKTKCGTYSLRSSSPGGSGANSGWDVHQAAATLRSITYVKKGCKDSLANNTTAGATEEDGSCRYTTALISSFTASPSSIKVGETATISWTLSNTNFSEIKILANGRNIMPSAKKDAIDSSIPVSPTSVGTTYKMEVTWNKPNAPIRKADLNLSVVSAVSYVPCDPLDVHRNVDGNGECAGCKAGYSMIDATTGFCTNCEATNDDAYRDMNTDGTCGDCMAGYAEDTNGTCQKVGCMTYADGTSAEDDYNYDPDAVTNDSSMCQGADGGNGGNGGVPEDIDCGVSDWSDWSAWSDATTSSGTRTRTRTVVTGQSGGGAGCPSLEETETGVVDPNTGTVTITTMGGDAEPVETTTETKSLAAPLIIGGIVLTIGYLVMRR